MYHRNHKKYLIFAEKVVLIEFAKENVEIFKIQNVKAYSLHSFSIKEKKSQQFNVLFSRGFYFSYDFDLTHGFSFKNLLDFRKSPEPDWIYFANRTLMKEFFGKKMREWVVPVIFGRVNLINITSNQQQFKNSLIIKYSVFNLIFDREDVVLKNLKIRPSLVSFDLVMKTQDFYQINYVLCGVDKEQPLSDLDLQILSVMVKTQQNFATELFAAKMP